MEAVKMLLIEWGRQFSHLFSHVCVVFDWISRLIFVSWVDDDKLSTFFAFLPTST